MFQLYQHRSRPQKLQGDSLLQKTLGKFYTRTLQIIQDHYIGNEGLHSIIRHPGYLGTFIMEVGAGFAVTKWFVLIIILLAGLIVRVYRIQIEEEMLEASLGEQYKTYCETTWRFVPFYLLNSYVTQLSEYYYMSFLNAI